MISLNDSIISINYLYSLPFPLSESFGFGPKEYFDISKNNNIVRENSYGAIVAEVLPTFLLLLLV